MGPKTGTAGDAAPAIAEPGASRYPPPWPREPAACGQRPGFLLLIHGTSYIT